MMETTLAAMEHREKNTCEQSCPEGASGHPCSAKPLAWTAEDDAAFEAGVHLFGKDLALVAQLVGQAEVRCPTLDCDDHCYSTQHPSQAPSSCCWQGAAISCWGTPGQRELASRVQEGVLDAWASFLASPGYRRWQAAWLLGVTGKVLIGAGTRLEALVEGVAGADTQ